MSTRAWTAVILALVAGAGLATTGIVNLPEIGNLSAVDDRPENPSKKAIDEATAKLKMGASGADAVYFFTEEPAEAYPVYYSDHLNFDVAEATNKLQQGIDYYKVELGNDTTTTSGNHMVLEPGRYHYVVVDNHGDVHTAFGTVDIDGEFAEHKLDDDYQQLVRLPLDAKTTADSANVVTSTKVESGDAVYSPSSSLRGSGETDFETVQTVTHTIEVKKGAMYLGDIDLGTYTSGANVSSAELASATVDGQSVDALSNVDLTDHNLDKDIFGKSSAPQKATDEVVLTFRFEAESDLSNAESIVSGISVSDIYNTATAALSITG